jgi:NAD-dependent SIR2 family protein deacetylase
VAQREGAYLVEINPERTELSEVHDAVLRGSASEMLPQLIG